MHRARCRFCRGLPQAARYRARHERALFLAESFHVLLIGAEIAHAAFDDSDETCFPESLQGTCRRAHVLLEREPDCLGLFKPGSLGSFLDSLSEILAYPDCQTFSMHVRHS